MVIPLICATLLGCAGSGSVADAKLTCCQGIEGGSSSTNRSVYRLTSDWTTDAGKTVKLDGLRGKPQVVAMFFTSCGKACPILVDQLRQLAESLPESLRAKAGFLLVSFDPERDTPEVLRAYRAARNLPANQWTLLRGSPEAVRELAQVLDVNYRQGGAGGQFAHSSVVTILDSCGEIAFQQFGLNSSIDPLKARLVGILER
jgi:protein SCO1/2